MSETIACPACSAQFPYMPDLVGLRVNCPSCKHPFTVVAPARRFGQRAADLVPTLARNIRPIYEVEETATDDGLPQLLPDPDDRSAEPEIPVGEGGGTRGRFSLAAEAVSSSPSPAARGTTDGGPYDLSDLTIGRRASAPSRSHDAHRPIIFWPTLWMRLRRDPRWWSLGISAVLGLLVFGLFVYAALSMRARERLSASSATASTPAGEPAQPAVTHIKAATAGSATQPVSIGYQTLSSRFGPDRVVRVNVTPPAGRQPDAKLAAKAYSALRPMADEWACAREPDHLECVLAPVDDVAAFAGRLSDFSAATSVDDASRTVTLQLK